jgi:hypothetical protein
VATGASARIDWTTIADGQHGRPEGARVVEHAAVGGVDDAMLAVE